MKNLIPDFSKKVVSVGFANDSSHALNCPRWETQGGKLFLVGTVPPGGSSLDWCEGNIAAIAWENVTDYIVFDSADHYQKRLAIYEKRKRKAGKKNK